MVNNAGLGGTVELRRHDRRAVDVRARRHAERHVPLHARRAAPHVERGAAASIVNNASVLGWRAQAGQAHYAAAKAGVMALTRCAAIEAAAARRAGQRGGAEPGDAPVPRQGRRPTSCSPSSTTREAFGRAAEPWEIANVIVFLAERLLVLHDRRGRLRQQPAPLTRPHRPTHRPTHRSVSASGTAPSRGAYRRRNSQLAGHVGGGGLQVGGALAAAVDHAARRP